MVSMDQLEAESYHTTGLIDLLAPGRCPLRRFGSQQAPPGSLLGLGVLASLCDYSLNQTLMLDDWREKYECPDALIAVADQKKLEDR